MAAAGRVLVYGGRGALGSQCVQYFKARNWVSAGRAAAGPGGARRGCFGGGEVRGGGRTKGAPPGANGAFSPPQWVASIDLAENEDASVNVVVRATESFPEQAEQVGARRGAGGARGRPLVPGSMRWVCTRSP